MPADPRRVKELFGAALEISERDARQSFLDRECAGDVDLRRRLDVLLAAHDQPESALERPLVVENEKTGSYREISEGPGTIIGPYKLLQQIGEGGFGVVFMAEQTQPVRRTVALKIIKPGMDTAQVIARFESERQALALMDHPNIAKVLDARATESGRPYFVMELVKGVPITEFCDKNHMPAEGRLKLFIDVCHAIQHAHHKGVIHRDIKPSNVMVTLHDGVPVVKVIDFGVAKATVQKLTERTLFTAYGQMIGTPAYMSPEQAEMSGLDIDTRSDVYSLGVLLYELLTGTTPLESKRLRDAGYAEMQRLIRDEAAPRPSTRLSSLGESATVIAGNRGLDVKRLVQLLSGDLDWVVLKALDKDRNRRYGTPGNLAEDIERYMRREAILARPPSTAYKLKKFTQRNRAFVVTAMAMLFVLLAGIAGTTIGLIRAEKRRVEAEQARANEAEQRTIAEGEKRKAQEAEEQTLASYRASTDDAIEQLIGSKPELGPQERTYLTKTMERWQEFAKREGNDERSQAIRAEGHFRLGNLSLRLGLRDGAQKEYETARDLRKKLADAFPAVPEYQEDLAATHNNLGTLLDQLGKRDEARKEYMIALALQKKLADAFPAVPLFQERLAGTHNNLGIMLGERGMGDDARKEHEMARDLKKKLADAFPAVLEYQVDLANTHTNLGLLLSTMGKGKAALKELEAARDIYKKLPNAFLAAPQYQAQLATMHNNLGFVLDGLGKYVEARQELEITLALRRKLINTFPAVSRYQVQLCGTYCNFGNLIRHEGKPADSLHWLDLAIRTLTPVHEKEPRDAWAKKFLRNSHENRALAYDELKKHTEAVKDWDRAVELSPKAEQPFYRLNRANSRLQAGQVVEAVAEVAELTKQPGADTPNAPKWTADEWYNFTCFYAVASGKVADKKKEYADRAMELLQEAVKAGFKDAAHMAKDTDLDPLRGREDFKKLLAELESRKPTDKKP